MVEPSECRGQKIRPWGHLSPRRELWGALRRPSPHMCLQKNHGWVLFPSSAHRCLAAVDFTCSEVLALSNVCGAQRPPGRQSLQPCCGGSPAWVPGAPASVGTSDAQGRLGGKPTVALQGTVALRVPLQMLNHEAYPPLRAVKPEKGDLVLVGNDHFLLRRWGLRVERPGGTTLGHPGPHHG